ncbi:MAG: Ig-like domain-containing protein [Methylobacter sp.]
MILAIFLGSFLGEPVWAAIGIDATSSGDKGTATNTVSNTQAFSTSAGNELLLAFVSTDYLSGANTTVTGVSGAGLSWALVVRTNTQRGTSEIWRAFATAPLSNVTVTATLSQSVVSSITVMSFTGVDTSGTNGSGAIGATKSANASSGAPTATLITTRAGSWVLGGGNDYDNAIARTPGSNQNLVHQYLAPVGDTYWVQRQNSPTPLSGSSVTINDTAPTGDRYNLSIVEVLPLVGSGGSTFNISGAITPTTSGSGTSVTLTQNGATIATVTADSSGNYSFANIANGTYTVTPSKAGFTFSPSSQSVTVNGSNVINVNFTAQVTTPPSSLLYPDLLDIIPTGKMSIVGTGSSRTFQYTHDTLNGGPGPLVIQPVYNSASGQYQGTQYIYSLSSSGVWESTPPLKQIPVAGAFIFDSLHGHFHFPFVTYGLYTDVNGHPGTPVAVSSKNSFCINDSFIYEPLLPNAGALGNLGSCSDPTSLRGLDIGAVDEYDQTDPGQSISIAGLPDGTYWLKALVDPNNFLAESDKTNNETDVQLIITGTTIQVLATVTPVLNTPPIVTLTSPLDGSILTGNVGLTASPATTSNVQFLVDGQPFGGLISAPYSVTWNTSTVPDGVHWLAVQTTDSTGIIGTSPVVMVNVANATNSGPVVQLTSPTTGSILSATATLYATVASSQPIAKVDFFVDNGTVPVGTATSSPYMVSWDTTKVSDGTHVVTAVATDTLNNVGYSTPVSLTVNNSHPANLIGKDVSVSADGQGAINTPSFSTSTASDLLLAFVAYDGPSNSPQTASVSGAGLTWTLLERSNTQSGTAEIWSARANGLLSNVTVTSQPGTGSGYHGSLTVIAFTNAYGTSEVGRTGAPSGAPDIPLPGVIAGDWVFAVGNDWDSAIARTPVSGQVLVHQKVDTTVGDTYWVQSTTAPSTANGLVDIHDTQPTSDRWNYAAVEIVATHQ